VPPTLTRLLSTCARFWREEDGQDLLEYSLLTGIIGISSLLLFTEVAPKMAAAYTSWNGAQVDAWEPNAPLGP
jgi:Flp pilus assembly pilin Flp